MDVVERDMKGANERDVM